MSVSEPVPRRVGPPVLLGLRPRFVERAFATARLDDRIRALSFFGVLAGGGADEWEGVQFVATVADDAAAEVVEELGRRDNWYGQSILTWQDPNRGVAGGGFLNVTYFLAGLPVCVDWYVTPKSLGVPSGDTKTLFSRDGWPTGGPSFASLLDEHPSGGSEPPSPSDVLVSQIPHRIAQVARGHLDAVEVDGHAAADRIEAYDALAKEIAGLSGPHSDLRAVYFYYLGIARRGR